MSLTAQLASPLPASLLPAGVSAAITPAQLDTVLGSLAPLFLTGANGDLPTARHAAAQILAAYDAETPDELSLAAQIISFGFEALTALSQAANPDLPLTRVLRLRGSAVSLSREGHKARRKLDQLQRGRRIGVPAQPADAPAEISAAKTGAAETGAELPFPKPCNRRPETAPTAQTAAVAGLSTELAHTTVEPAHDAVEPARDAAEPASNPELTWTQRYHQRQTAKRLAKRLAKKPHQHAGRPAPLHPAAPGAAAAPVG